MLNSAWVGSKRQSPFRLFLSKQAEVESTALCQGREKNSEVTGKEKMSPGPCTGEPMRLMEWSILPD